MASLEDENREALARPFPYMQRKRLTAISRELPQLRGVLGTNWARSKELFELAHDRKDRLLASDGMRLVEPRLGRAERSRASLSWTELRLRCCTLLLYWCASWHGLTIRPEH